MARFSAIRGALALAIDIAAIASLAYMAAAVAASARFARRVPDASRSQPPVTLLVPLHGLEFSLDANLRAFVNQDYPQYQVVFGVARADDAALAVAQQVRDAFPDRSIVIAIGFEPSARNPKLANVLSMMRYVEHDTFVLADSDTLVDQHYLRTVTAPLENPEVGAVTALFSGHADDTFASRFGAMFMNESFVPAALVERLGGPLRHCFGPTNAFRGETLRAIGGFEALAPHLADDFMLGNFIAALGKRIVISSYVVKTTIAEPSIRALFTHELRWHRTIRRVSPAGYAGMFLIFPFTLALCALALWPSRRRSVVLAAAVFARLALQRVAARALDVRPAALWAVPLRDCFGFALWAWAFTGSSVRWRGADLRIGTGDVLSDNGRRT